MSCLEIAQPPVNTRCKATYPHFGVMCYVARLAKKAGTTADGWGSFPSTYKGKCNTSNSFHGTATEVPCFFNQHLFVFLSSSTFTTTSTTSIITNTIKVAAMKSTVCSLTILAGLLASTKATPIPVDTSLKECGDQWYSPHSYTCRVGADSNALCPVVNGEAMDDCNGACYTPLRYRWLSSLSTLGAVTDHDQLQWNSPG